MLNMSYTATGLRQGARQEEVAKRVARGKWREKEERWVLIGA